MSLCSSACKICKWLGLSWDIHSAISLCDIPSLASELTSSCGRSIYLGTLHLVMHQVERQQGKNRKAVSYCLHTVYLSVNSVVVHVSLFLRMPLPADLSPFALDRHKISEAACPRNSGRRAATKHDKPQGFIQDHNWRCCTRRSRVRNICLGNVGQTKRQQRRKGDVKYEWFDLE